MTIRSVLDLMDAFVQAHLSMVALLPFIAVVGSIAYFIFSGAIPVRGRTISRALQPTAFWFTLAMIFLLVGIPSLLIAMGH
jgi:hypothetical protein